MASHMAVTMCHPLSPGLSFSHGVDDNEAENDLSSLASLKNKDHVIPVGHGILVRCSVSPSKQTGAMMSLSRNHSLFSVGSESLLLVTAAQK